MRRSLQASREHVQTLTPRLLQASEALHVHYTRGHRVPEEPLTTVHQFNLARKELFHLHVQHPALLIKKSISGAVTTSPKVQTRFLRMRARTPALLLVQPYSKNKNN